MKTTVSFCLSAPLVTTLEALAREHARSVSGLVEELLGRALTMDAPIGAGARLHTSSARREGSARVRALTAVCEAGRADLRTICAALPDLAPGAVREALSVLVARGALFRVAPGVYSASPPEAPAG